MEKNTTHFESEKEPTSPVVVTEKEHVVHSVVRTSASETDYAC